MSERDGRGPDEGATPAGDAPPATESAGIAHIERTFLRLTFWQTLLSLAGVFTGAVALYAALNESQAVREQTAASVWPYVQIMINDTDDGTEAYFSLVLENVGVGPARMQGIELLVGGRAVRSWEGVTAQLLDAEARVGVDFGRSDVARRVIGPGESITAFQTDQRPLALALQQSVYGDALSLRYCYCSIFDQCWLGHLAQGLDAASTEPVAQCPDFGERAFQN